LILEFQWAKKIRIMKYYIVSESVELMRTSYFHYRQKITDSKTAIVALVENEYANESDFLKASKKLLSLEGEYRNIFGKWDCPPVKLDVQFFPKYSL